MLKMNNSNKKILFVGVIMMILLLSFKPHKESTVPVNIPTNITTETYPTIYDMKTKNITVKKGDTFWSIAQENKWPGYTTDQFSELIMSLNHVTNSGTLQVGKQIKVPISE